MRSWVVLNSVDNRTRYATFFRGASGYEPELTCGGSTDGNLCGKKIWRSAQNQPQLGIRRPPNAPAHRAETKGDYLVH